MSFAAQIMAHPLIVRDDVHLGDLDRRRGRIQRSPDAVGP